MNGSLVESVCYPHLTIRQQQAERVSISDNVMVIMSVKVSFENTENGKRFVILASMVVY